MPTFDDVRSIAMALPEAEEIVTWETDITFRVRKKIFAIGGEGADRVSIKATPTVQAELLDLDAETFARAAYVGRFGWITADLARVDLAVLEGLLRDAWRSAAPTKLRDQVPPR
jgi:predicted DNA-binding protein (MmcQ/YjbR family)